MSTHWRRRWREIVERPRRPLVDNAGPPLVLLSIAVSLLIVTTALWGIAQLEQFGPSVGAVIVFRPSAMMTDRWQINASVGDPADVDRLDPVAASSCVLSPGTMEAGGGSFIIEARRLSRPPVYRVHWAGSHTSQGAGDCGTAVDLVLSRTELMRLANVAGGFGGGLRLIGP
jgi:hypothetical protein